jgi:hypothetical protein
VSGSDEIPRDADPRSGVHGSPTSEYPDLRHSGRAEPAARAEPGGGAQGMTQRDLDRLAEQRAAEDRALGAKKPSFWKRLFGRR